MSSTPAAIQDAHDDLVHADLLRFFPELVEALGGRLEAVLERSGVAAEALYGRDPLGFRACLSLLEAAAGELGLPDFGLRLAARQGGGTVFGPIGVAMRNSATFGEALTYVAEHGYAHSLAARMRLIGEGPDLSCFVAYDLLLERGPSQRQAIEQMLLLAHLNAMESTGGRARVRQVRFRHQPMSPLRTYRRHFGCDVLFDQPQDGILFRAGDLAARIVDPDRQLYARITSFIDARFKGEAQSMRARVRALVLQFIESEDCSNERVAAELGLHPRTLHRRLAAEGSSFIRIKDEVRRDVTLRFLRETDLPLTLIAQRLGYAEQSVLTRSCERWFSAAPSQLRLHARADLDPCD